MSDGNAVPLILDHETLTLSQTQMVLMTVMTARENDKIFTMIPQGDIELVGNLRTVFTKLCDFIVEAGAPNFDDEQLDGLVAASVSARHMTERESMWAVACALSNAGLMRARKETGAGPIMSENEYQEQLSTAAVILAYSGLLEVSLEEAVAQWTEARTSASAKLLVDEIERMLGKGKKK